MSTNLNNSVLNVFKVSDEILSRLFTHKPFIFGEIRFLIKEFEENGNELEFDKPMETLKRITDFKESKMDFAIESCNQFNDRLNGSIDSLNNLMQEILGLEADQLIQRSDVLKSRKEERNQELIDLIQLSKDRINQIDGQSEEQEKKLRLFYKDLETKLNIIPKSDEN